MYEENGVCVVCERARIYRVLRVWLRYAINVAVPGEIQRLSELVDEGHDPELVDRVVRLVDVAEFKRRQTPLGPKVTTRGFGRDRRMPIVNHFRG